MGMFWVAGFLVVVVFGFGKVDCREQYHHQPPKNIRVAKPWERLTGALKFEDAYENLFGDGNIKVSKDGSSVSLLMTKSSGSGILSQDVFMHGFFSASIKLPEDYTAGIVTAFYTSNGGMFPGTHDELDFEFLGNIRGQEWRMQTNIYGNGSTESGREERYTLWFDPSEDFHQYSILWTSKSIIFFVDEVPIREVLKTESMGLQYPSKPMSVYSTIWDGSTWATKGGRFKVNYRYAPFIMTLSNLILEGNAIEPIIHQNMPSSSSSSESMSIITDKSTNSTSFESITELSEDQRAVMAWFRSKYITYSYCDDEVRYPVALAECPPRIPGKKIATERIRYHGHRHGSHRSRNRHHSPRTSAAAAAATIA